MDGEGGVRVCDWGVRGHGQRGWGRGTKLHESGRYAVRGKDE